METLASPLVLTKLRAPALRTRQVHRARLIDLIASESSARLILVCAPAGYGKTTLLVEWAQSLTKDGIAVAWYALDSTDDTPTSFSSYLIASFTQALGPIPELTQIAQLLRASPEIDLQRILPAVINVLLSSGQECVLILDDYHLIGAPAIHSAIAYLLEHLPENLRLAIGSRSDPPLPLARLRARRQMIEIRTAGLRFNADEAAQFINEVMQLELSPEGLARLEQRTEGWAAGLQLMALSLAGHADKEHLLASFAGSHRYLGEYLLEEVVSRLPEETQSFLLSTSILERLCAPLCDQLLGQPETGNPDAPASSSQAILARLEKSNLFLVPLDDEQTWYRYHHLFRAFLQTQLGKIESKRTPALHRAACEWLAERGFLREAANHAFQTQDWEYAAAFVEQYSFTLLIHSEISTIYEWCSLLSEEVMPFHPMLCIMQALALAYSFRRQNRPRAEARLQQAGRVIAELADMQTVRELNEFIAVVHTFLAMAPDPAADPQALLSLAHGILAHYPEEDPGRFSGLLLTGYAYLALHNAPAAQQAFETARPFALRERLFFGIVESTFHLARLAHQQGQLHHAAEICRQGQADIAALLAQPEKEVPALGSLEVALACILMEQDQLAEAELRLRQGLDLMGGGANPYYLMTAYVALFRLCEFQGRTAEALKSLAHLEVMWPDIAFFTNGLRRLHAWRLAPDDPNARAEVDHWRRAFPAPSDQSTPPGMGPFGAAEVYYLASLEWARAQVAVGEAQAAIPYLARQLDLAAANGLTNRVIELSLLEARAWQASGQAQRARNALERALAAAQPAGYRRIFDQGPAMTRLLVEAIPYSAHKEYIEQILSTLGAPAGLSPQPARPSIQSPGSNALSQRQLEVLRLIAQGASNHEIAERLVITIGTVKSHTNHILRKLEARNRTEAVARAREMGLLRTW